MRWNANFMSLILAIGFFSCRTPVAKNESEVEGIGVPTEEGVPVTFISDLPAQVGHEMFKNMGLLIKAGNPDGKFSHIRPMDISISCEAMSPQENHCRLIYDGPELRLKVADLLFRSMAGEIYVRRGCTGQGCRNEPMKMWWRTVAKTLPRGEENFEFEVCDIRGIEAGIGVKTPFAVGNQLLDKIAYKPDIKGFKATIVRTEIDMPAFDEQGNPVKSDSGMPLMTKVPSYKALGVQAGLGPLGAFPNSRCLLKGDQEEAYFKRVRSHMEGKDLPLNKEALAQIPGNYVRFAMDVSSHIAKESQGQSMHLNFRCQDVPLKPVCEMRYTGPQVTIPIPSYITGMFDSEVQILRQCQNPGCKQAKEAVVTMTTYVRDQIETIEMCSIEGMELTTLRKLPHQNRILGAPDIKGMIVRIEPGLEPHPAHANDPRYVSEAKLKSAHLGFAGVGRYPSQKCQFVRN